MSGQSAGKKASEVALLFHYQAADVLVGGILLEVGEDLARGCLWERRSCFCAHLQPQVAHAPGLVIAHCSNLCHDTIFSFAVL